MAKVSIIMGIYNCAPTLPEAIDSILTQSFSDWQLVLCDDGSTDNSAALIEEAARRDSRIHLQRQENRHAGEARNSGIESASGEYIAFLDADDIYYSDKALELLLCKARETGADMG